MAEPKSSNRPHEGDEFAFDAVYEAQFSFVWRSVGRLGVPASAVDDVVQDVFVVVHRKLGDFERRSSIKTWLFAIVRRTVRDHARARSRKPTDASHAADVDIEGIVADGDRGPHEAAAKAEAVRTLYALLDQLDDDKREVFVLTELEQMTIPEVAEAVGINVNTAYARLRAARTAFSEALARRRARDAWDDRVEATERRDTPKGRVEVR